MMILHCTGTEEYPHEEVRWRPVNLEDIECWLDSCTQPGRTVTGHIIAVEHWGQYIE